MNDGTTNPCIPLRLLQRLSCPGLLGGLFQLDPRDMLTRDHNQPNQSTGHIYFDVLRISRPAVIVFLIIRAGSDLFNGRGGREAIFVCVCEDDIPGLDSRIRGLVSCRFFSFSFSFYRNQHALTITYRIRTLERAHEYTCIGCAHPQGLTD